MISYCLIKIEFSYKIYKNKIYKKVLNLKNYWSFCNEKITIPKNKNPFLCYDIGNGNDYNTRFNYNKHRTELDKPLVYRL